MWSNRIYYFPYFSESFSLFAKFSHIKTELLNIFNNDIGLNSKLIFKPTLNINSEFLNKENLLNSKVNSKDIFQSLESRFAFDFKPSAYSNVCLKHCFELINLDLDLQNPYLRILSHAYESRNCSFPNSAYPWNIKEMVSFVDDSLELETLISSVKDELISYFNFKN